VRSLGASVGVFGVVGELTDDDPSRGAFWTCTGGGLVSVVRDKDEDDDDVAVAVAVAVAEELVLAVVEGMVDVVDADEDVSFATCAFQSLTIVFANLETSASACVFSLLTNRPISVFYVTSG
jgi:hypothetical protein